MERLYNRVKEIIKEEAGEYMKSYCENVLNRGCVSGCVGELIYYRDTNVFYDDYEEEIEDLIEDLKEELGFKNRLEFINSLNGADNVHNIKTEKNLLSWFAFEEMTKRFYEEEVYKNE